MIALLLGSAFAAQTSTATGAGRDCPNPSAIYGTSGFSNLQQALRTNAVTYAASTFAERLGLDQPANVLAEKDTRAFVVWETNNSYDVARVPVYNRPVDEIEQPDCDYLIGERGVDLQATLLAGVFGTKQLGGFFAASQTSGQVASTDNLMRGIYWGYLYPLYGTLPLVASPFIQGEARAGTTAVALDAVYGMWVDNKWVLAKAGYTHSSGFYASAREYYLGAFFTAVYRPGDGTLPVLRAGIQKLDLGDDAPEAMGMPSLFYRDIPMAQPVDEDETEGDRLKTTHAEMEDMFHHLDVAAAFRVQPQPTLNEASLAYHNRTYHLREDEELDKVRGYFFAKAGMVELVEQVSLGVEGGHYPSARVEVGFHGPHSALGFHLYINEPEQLALYPFARNAVSTQMHFEVSKW